MVFFVGAGPGASDLITLRGAALLRQAGQVIYAGSLVNSALLESCRPDCRVLDSAEMTLEEVVGAIRETEAQGIDTVRLHTGDPSVYGTIREQIDELNRLGIEWAVVPGVSSFSAAAAALGAEYTLPGLSQSLILTRLAGRTPVPEKETLASLAAHGSSMAVFLSAGMGQRVQEELLKGGYDEETPVAVVFKASWPEERIIRCHLKDLEKSLRESGITKTALILVGDFLEKSHERSRLYAPDFATGYRAAKLAGDAESEMTEAHSLACESEDGIDRNCLKLIGCGCGRESLSGDAMRAIREADLLLGSPRLLGWFPEKKGRAAISAGDLETALEEIGAIGGEKERTDGFESTAENAGELSGERAGEADSAANGNGKKICILYSGDSGFYSGASQLLKRLEEGEKRREASGSQGIEVLPGLSSLQLLAARLKEPWENWRLCSAHGRYCDPIRELCKGQDVFFLTGGSLSPAELCQKLTKAGLGFLPAVVGEDLGTTEERIVRGNAEEFSGQKFAPLSVLLCRAAPRRAQTVPGIPDGEFLRREGIPMTKQEIRATALSKLAVRAGDICWDIGAGTGSVSVELALQAKSVWAVEPRREALALAEENRKRFGAWNLRLIEGRAPEALAGLPRPDAVFVGGSGAELPDILRACLDANPCVRLCITAISPETLAQALESLKQLGREPEITQISISRSRPAGEKHLMLAMNPVFLISSAPEDEGKKELES